MARKLFVSLAFAALGLCLLISLMTDHSYVTTPSMYPTIPPGSEVFVSHTKDVHVGQVIVFQANGLIWAHRLIKMNPDGTLVTKGDNPQNAPDVFIPSLTKSDVIGVVTFAPRWLGFPQLIVNHPSYGLAWLRAELGVGGRILLSVVAGLLSCALAARNRAKKNRGPGGASVHADGHAGHRGKRLSFEGGGTSAGDRPTVSFEPIAGYAARQPQVDACSGSNAATEVILRRELPPVPGARGRPIGGASNRRVRPVMSRGTEGVM